MLGGYCLSDPKEFLAIAKEMAIMAKVLNVYSTRARRNIHRAA